MESFLWYNACLRYKVQELETVVYIEKRRELRHREFKHAKILADGEFHECFCEIHNISIHGAELGVGIDQQMPEEFQLHVRADQKTFHCRQVWRDGTRMGVEFIGG